jgi:hypothetical protein
MVATEVELLDHATVDVQFVILALLQVQVAVNCCVLPTWTLAELGETEMLVSVGPVVVLKIAVTVQLLAGIVPE